MYQSLSCQVRHFACLAVLFSLMSGSQATVRYVAQAGQTPDPTGGYTSWSGAASNLQEVLDLPATVNNDIIYVTNGVYKLTDEILVSKRVTIRSYNAEGKTDPENTILDADNYEGKPVENRVMRITNKAVIDGFTFTGGRRSGSGHDNIGGGIRIDTTGTPAEITNCTITANYSGNSGGGLGVYMSSCNVVDCRIVNNESTGWGGGVYLYNYGHVIGEIHDSVIGWNKSASTREGSGIALNDFSAATKARVYNCDIVSNANHFAVGFIGHGNISNCVIRGTTNSLNGAVGSRSSASGNMVINCQIVDNYGGGGLIDRSITYRNCLIARNKGLYYGGLRYTDGSTGGTVENCTVAYNTADRAIEQGGSVGGLWISLTDATFRNTIFHGNSGVTEDDLWFSNALTQTEGPDCFFNSCCSTYELPAGQGNVFADPKFVNAAGGNYQLRGSSDCINAGQNQAWMTGAFDIAGNPRLDKYEGIVDIGCYEHVVTGSLLMIK